MTPPALDVRGLGFRYPDGHRALDGVDLTVAAGERLAILGPNGAGKTTLVLALNGINAASEGSVTVGGLAVERANLREIRRRVGIVFQDPDDQLFMSTVREDVAFGPANLGLRGDELAARTTEALEAVGMAHCADRSPHLHPNRQDLGVRPGESGDDTERRDLETPSLAYLVRVSGLDIWNNLNTRLLEIRCNIV